MHLHGYFCHFLRDEKTIISLRNYDIVFIGFAPQLVLPLFWHKFKKSNASISIIEDFFISLFDTLCCDRKKIKPDSLFGRFLHYIDQITLYHTDAVICDTNTIQGLLYMNNNS